MFGGINAHSIIGFQFRHDANVILNFKVTYDTFVTAGLLSISMPFVIWGNFFPKIFRVAKKERRLAK